MLRKSTIDRLLSLSNRFNFERNYTNSGANPKHNLNNFSMQYRSNQIAAGDSKCWRCGIERRSIADLFCESCHSIQNPHERNNYFKVFNLDVTYDVNQNNLTSTYRKMQSVLHPDKFSNKSDTEKEISAEYSSLVNKAYKTLQTPINRAIHLLSLNNEVISEDNMTDDPEFLMAMMELNEEIEEANASEDFRILRDKNNEMLKRCSEEVSRYFKEGDIQKAKECVVRMKYYNSISKRINDLMRDRGIVD